MLRGVVTAYRSPGPPCGLASAARLVKPGGRLVYATCSILQEENDAVADDFLRESAEFRPFSCAEALAAARIALDTGERLRVSPHLQGMDGFFAACFVKVPSA